MSRLRNRNLSHSDFYSAGLIALQKIAFSDDQVGSAAADILDARH